jgi:hypothetical protein
MIGRSETAARRSSMPRRMARTSPAMADKVLSPIDGGDCDDAGSLS